MGSTATTVQMQIPVADLNLDSTRTYYLTDYFTGQTFSGTKATLASLTMPINAYTTRILVLDTVAITGIEPGSVATVPTEVSLAQNFPNPFNPSTSIRFELPSTGKVSLKVYDMLGREVAVLMDGVAGAGQHEVVFNGNRMASGMYVYRLEYSSRSLVRKMIILK
jgi:hypothetical protein